MSAPPGDHHEQGIRQPGRPRRQEDLVHAPLGERVRVHRRGRSEHRRLHRRRGGDGRRHAGDAGDGAGPDPAHPRGHAAADQVRAADPLSRGARARCFGLLQGRRAGDHRQPRHVRPDGRARRAGQGERDRPLPAPVSRCRVGAARPQLADDDVRGQAERLARQEGRGQDRADRPRPHQGRHDRLSRGPEDLLRRRPGRVPEHRLRRRLLLPRLAGDARPAPGPSASPSSFPAAARRSRPPPASTRRSSRRAPSSPTSFATSAPASPRARICARPTRTSTPRSSRSTATG